MNGPLHIPCLYRIRSKWSGKNDGLFFKRGFFNRFCQSFSQIWKFICDLEAVLPYDEQYQNGPRSSSTVLFELQFSRLGIQRISVSDLLAKSVTISTSNQITSKNVRSNRRSSCFAEYGSRIYEQDYKKSNFFWKRYHPTPPIAEILCVKNGRAIVVCGFLMR